MKGYNATVYRVKGGKVISVFVCETHPQDSTKMIRSNAIQYTGLEGTLDYDKYIREQYKDSYLNIVLDNCEGYKRKLRGLALPPTYLGIAKFKPEIKIVPITAEKIKTDFSRNPKGVSKILAEILEKQMYFPRPSEVETEISRLLLGGEPSNTGWRSIIAHWLKVGIEPLIEKPEMTHDPYK